MKKQTSFLLFAMLLVLSGCASLGVPVPRSFNEGLTAGYLSAAAANSTLSSLLNNRLISSNDAENSRAQVVQMKTGLDVAASLRGANPEVAQSKLEATILMLNALQSYLQGLEKK